MIVFLTVNDELTEKANGLMKVFMNSFACLLYIIPPQELFIHMRDLRFFKSRVNI
jgi:hypothetical protein